MLSILCREINKMATIHYLPLELLQQIFEKLCFHTVQKICTLVCKEWYIVIRNHPKLSSSLRLKLQENLPIEFTEVWSKLKCLTLTHKQEKFLSKLERNFHNFSTLDPTSGIFSGL